MSYQEAKAYETSESVGNVSDQVMRFENLAHRLDTVVGELTDRLSAILKPDTPQAVDVSNQSKMVNSPLAKTLNEYGSVIERNVDNIHGVLARLDL